MPKDNGKKTRLIFYLSYDFDEEMRSVNHFTPKEKCTVKYQDLDYAVQTCLDISMGKADSKFHWDTDKDDMKPV